MKLRFFTALTLVMTVLAMMAQNNVAEEVAWVIGDEPIFKSDIEEQYQQALMERIPIDGNPYCVIPEKMAIDKLFLDQARIDTVEVQQSAISAEVENRINFFIANLGSKEKVEEYFRMPLPRLREKLSEVYSDQYCIQQVQSELTKNVKATPAEVQRFYNSLSKDSLPYIPMQVEVQIITINPVIPQQEIDEVKARLRDYAQQVNSGEREFSTLAILYSQDQSTAVYGGETGFQSRSVLLPEYATAAFNLNDNKRVFNIVETDDGYHIIQLVEKRGDKVNVRHILKKPVVSDEAIEKAIGRLDSIAADIRQEKFSFEEAASLLSDDKDTRNNKGLMSNTNMQTGRISSKFQMQDLPQEVAKVVDTMQVGQISQAFQMINQRGKTVCAIVKLKNRVEGHKASISEDFQVMKDVVLNKRNEERVHQWVVDKIKSVYTRLNENYRDCKFEYEGWFK